MEALQEATAGYCRLLRAEDFVNADGEIRQEFGSGLLSTMEDAMLAIAGPIER